MVTLGDGRVDFYVSMRLVPTPEALGSNQTAPPRTRVFVQEERRAGNPVAGLIDSLQLEHSRVTLLLRCAAAAAGVAGVTVATQWLLARAAS